MKQNQCGYHLQKRFHSITKVPIKWFSKFYLQHWGTLTNCHYRWFEIMSGICYILRKKFLDRKSIGSKGRLRNAGIDTF